jgi:ATP adenylyltransferase
VAGAGVADHLHMHVLPRWAGDTSFMTTVAETRLEPEELATTYAKLKPYFEK